MISTDEWRYVVPHQGKAPERLKGRIVIARLTEGRLEFELDFPDDPTPQELAWFKGLAQEVGDKAGLDLDKLTGPEPLK